MSVPVHYAEFEATLKKSQPQESWPVALQALWWDAKGAWNTAHNLVDHQETTMGMWVHAYLHRKEGDEWNAGYWYRRAGKPFCKLSLAEEWRQLVKAVITGN